MRIMLDDTDCSLSAGSVGEAIMAGAEIAESRGRLVVEIYVDGEKLTDESLGEEQRLASGADEVRLVSVEPHEMVRQTLLDSVELLEQLDQTQRNAAERLQTSDEAGGFEMLGDAVEMWSIVQRATLQSAQLLEMDLQSISTSDTSMTEGIHLLNRHLGALRDALQQRDPVGVSDALLYEMPPVIETWKGLLRTMAETARPDAE